MLPFSARCWHPRVKPLLLPQQASPPPDVSASRLDGNGQRWGGLVLEERLSVPWWGAMPTCAYTYMCLCLCLCVCACVHVVVLCACRPHFSFPFVFTFARCIEASAWHHGGAASLVCVCVSRLSRPLRNCCGTSSPPPPPRRLRVDVCCV